MIRKYDTSLLQSMINKDYTFELIRYITSLEDRVTDLESENSRLKNENCRLNNEKCCLKNEIYHLKNEKDTDNQKITELTDKINSINDVDTKVASTMHEWLKSEIAWVTSEIHKEELRQAKMKEIQAKTQA